MVGRETRYELWPVQNLADIISALKRIAPVHDEAYLNGWVNALDAVRVAIGAITEEEAQALERKGE